MNRNIARRLRIASSETDVEEQTIDIPVVNNTEARQQLITSMENVALDIIQQICNGCLPQVSYVSSEDLVNTENVESFFDESNQEPEYASVTTLTSFANRGSRDKFTLMMVVMAAAHRLLITNCTKTRRSLYYDLKNEKTGHLVPDQRKLDQTVKCVANLMNCAPWELNLLSTMKGLAAGELKLTMNDNKIVDCTVPGGALIPLMSNIISVRARAKLVLVVEKDTVFQKLLEDGCTSVLKCVLVTGKGYPDVATRMFVKFLSERLKLPVYIIVDADPFGVEIMCVYRFGSTGLSRERESLVCPNARWLGIHPSELLALGVNTVPLTAIDLSRLTSLEGKPYMTNAILKELEVMRNGKAEIENLSPSSRKFLVATYLTCKIKGDDCI
ncbi:meiotic recombination protein W68 [Ceratina calcarata]|uniref:DNA topoisomerase (ATP-hydrolyzing) n=1 Tax=Ceratina calcarata TaxID=156304 RepID=A0AAJ7IVQ1_9HYME|nr:meiotic recombination protein W68 [Ceratina calcarata]